MSSKGLQVINAQIIFEGIDTVYRGLNGYAISVFIPFVKNIPYQVKDKDYHTFTGTLPLTCGTPMPWLQSTSPLGTTNDEQISRPVIFPNPVLDDVNINWTENFTLFIFDINGRMV